MPAAMLINEVQEAQTPTLVAKFNIQKPGATPESSALKLTPKMPKNRPEPSAEPSEAAHPTSEQCQHRGPGGDAGSYRAKVQTFTSKQLKCPVLCVQDLFLKVAYGTSTQLNFLHFEGTLTERPVPEIISAGFWHSNS